MYSAFYTSKRSWYCMSKGRKGYRHNVISVHMLFFFWLDSKKASCTFFLCFMNVACQMIAWVNTKTGCVISITFMSDCTIYTSAKTLVMTDSVDWPFTIITQLLQLFWHMYENEMVPHKPKQALALATLGSFDLYVTGMSIKK